MAAVQQNGPDPGLGQNGAGRDNWDQLFCPAPDPGIWRFRRRGAGKMLLGYQSVYLFISEHIVPFLMGFGAKIPAQKVFTQ